MNFPLEKWATPEPLKQVTAASQSAPPPPRVFHLSLATYVGSALGVFGVFGSLSPLLVKANTGTKGSSLDTKYVCSPTFKCRSSLWWFVAFCTCLSPRLDRMMCDEQIKSLTIYHGTKIYNDSIPILVPISLLVQLVLFLSSI